jgi:hypothetical protein
MWILAANQPSHLFSFFFDMVLQSYRPSTPLRPPPSAPATFGVRSSMKLFRDYGKYDHGMDNNAKVEIYEPGTPLPPRTVLNFNPFETWEGNSPDASGIYPGETG